MPKSSPPTVAVIAYDGVIASDLATPIDVLGNARTLSGEPCYDLRVCGTTSPVDAGYFRIDVPFGLRGLAAADIVIVPGTEYPSAPVPDALLRALQSCSRKGTRIASICTGAFVLAEAGLLDGLKATTHWKIAPLLAQRYPAVQVDPNVLYVDNGQILTSAGAVAGVDLCLHLIRRDYGPVVAATSARTAVVPLERAGGQAQFMDTAPQTRDTGSLQPLLLWLEANLHQSVTLPILADRAAISVRTLHRRFIEQTGYRPNEYLTRIRLRSAQHLLESSSLPMERIAQQSGFGSVTNFRSRFRAALGISPSNYRAAFRHAN